MGVVLPLPVEVPGVAPAALPIIGTVPPNPRAKEWEKYGVMGGVPAPVGAVAPVVVRRVRYGHAIVPPALPMGEFGATIIATPPDMFVGEVERALAAI